MLSNGFHVDIYMLCMKFLYIVSFCCYKYVAVCVTKYQLVFSLLETVFMLHIRQLGIYFIELVHVYRISSRVQKGLLHMDDNLQTCWDFSFALGFLFWS